MARPGNPVVRVRHMRVFLDAVHALDEATSTKVLARLPAEAVTLVRESPTLSWLPVELNVDFVRAVSTVLGREANVEFFRSMVLRDFKTSLFDAFISGAKRVFGFDVGGLIKQVPAGFTLMFRDVGHLSMTERGPTRAVLVFEDLPGVCSIDGIWLESVRAGLLALFELASTEGCIALEVQRPSARATFRFEWKEPA